MKQRGISNRMAESTCLDADKIIEGKGDSEIAIKRFSNIRILVTFEALKRKEKTIKIISVRKEKW